MGSHPSKRIQSADVKTLRRPKTPQRSLSLSNTTTSTKVETFRAENGRKENGRKDRNHANPMESPKTHLELQNEITATNKLMTEIECQNIELQDQIQTLEQQLEFSQQECAKHPIDEACAETVQVKDQLIEKLEKEIEKLNTEMSDLRMKCKKKIRIMKRKSALANSEGSMEIVEIKAEMVKLEAENKNLRKRLSEKGVSSEELHHEDPTEHSTEDKDTGKMKIILNLSARVSEQDTLLTELGNKLNERDKYIAQLERDLKQMPSSDKSDSEKTHSGSKTRTNTTLEGDSFPAQTKTFGNSDIDNFNAEPEDINWYTNQTFEQLSKSTKATATLNGDIKGARAKTQDLTNDLDEDGKSELTAIADEIKKLQRGKKKKSRNQSSLHNGKIDLTQDTLHSSERQHKSAAEQGALNYGGVFLTQNTEDSDSCINIEGTLEYDSHEESHSGKSNMRQISGLGRKSQKRQSRSDQAVGDDRQSALINVKAKETQLSEASLLIDSIDEDMRQLTHGTQQQKFHILSN